MCGCVVCGVCVAICQVRSVWCVCFVRVCGGGLVVFVCVGVSGVGFVCVWCVCVSVHVVCLWGVSGVCMCLRVCLL